MTSREGISRPRLRQTAPLVDQVLTPLGRVSSAIPSISNSSTLNQLSSTTIPTTVVQNSGNVRVRHTINNPNNNNNNNNNLETDTNSIVDIGIFDSISSTPLITFDAEQFRSEIKANRHDGKRLEQLILNAINYFLTTSKRSSQQIADYTVLTFLAWTASLHGEIFRSSSVLKAMCILLKGSALTKTMKAFPTGNNGNINSGFPTTPYTLVCQILWLAFKDQTNWPDEFIEVYVEDALGEQNWIKNPDCQLFISNIQTAFHTRPCTWKLDRSKIFPTVSTTTATTTTQIISTINDDTSNDSNTNNESLVNTESESSIQTMDDPLINNNNTDNQLILSRYEGRSQYIQSFLQTLLTTNAKIKSTSGNSTTLNPTNQSTTTSNSTSQPHETDKLLYLLEYLCGLPDIRLYILSRLDIWLQNPKLTRTSERLMITLCENLTKPSLTNNTLLTNGHLNTNDTSYIDERAIEQLVNLRFKVRASNVTSKMYILCIREMLKNDANLVDLIVRFIVHNELQQISSPSTTTITSKNPNNLPLLHACCQSQPEHTCQSLAYTIQNILLLTNVTTTSKDYDNLLKVIRPFLRELMRYAKNEFDSMRFCMYLIDMHYSTHLQQQFWLMTHQQDSSANEITSHRLVKRLLECDMSTRERFLYAICDLIPMIILFSAHAFNSLTNTTNSNPMNTRSLTLNHDQWLVFIQRIAFIQCSSCLFFLLTLPRLFDSTSTINSINYVTCLYSILFTAQVNSYLRIENWPSEEPIGLRNDLFRLSSEIPLLGETLYLLIQIGLTPQFRISSSIIVDLIDLIVRRTLNVEQKMPNDYLSIYLRLPENRCEIFLTKFFDLTRYHIPIQIQFPSNYEIPKNLSITDIFWKTCLICLLLASHDPKIFGRFIWLSIPQIRLFMEMLLTGDYTYPPKSLIETKNFLEKFYLNERIQLREEKDLILELEKYLASPKMIDESNSQLLGKIISLDLQQIKRPLSHEKNEKDFYNLIQGLNNNYKLSSMLCRCRSPDFILDILNRKEQQGKTIFDSQNSWLTSLIDSNIDCLNVFPMICLCDYFQHMIMIYNKQNLPTKKTLHALETILIRFKSIIQTVKQQIRATIKKSSQIDDMTCIFNYFFNCLNSNISTMRSNAWLCLYIILHDHHPQFVNIEQLLSQSDQFSETNIELILSNISQFQSLEQTQVLIKQTLSETCQFETNISLLHYSIRFILDNCQIDSNPDQILLANLVRALNRRHSILYLLIQYDKQEQNCQLIEKYFHFILSIVIEKLQYSLEDPIQITSSIDVHQDEQSSNGNIQTYLVLPNLNEEQINLIKQFQFLLNLKNDFPWTMNRNKQYIQIDSILIEFLIIFLAYFDFNNQTIERLNQLARLIQQFLLNQISTPCFTTIKQFHPLVPIKQNPDEPSPRDDKEENHFKQFAIEDTEPIENSRKRRLSHSKSHEKVFLTTSPKPLYRIIPLNNENEQSLFLSDYLQYFLFKSNHFLLVKQCLDQASILTCLKMFQISVSSKENINYLCQHLNQLIDRSSKHIHTYIKQSTFILPLINRWIIEQLPEAIQLGEKLKRFLDKKKKSHSTTQDGISQLIPTTSRSSISIADQILSFDHRINKLCHQTSSSELSNNHQMDISEGNLPLPWKNLSECEEIVKYLLNKSFDSIKRRQVLIQLQLLTNSSEKYRFELLQTVIQCSQSISKDEFRKNLTEQYDKAFVLLNILTKNQSYNDDLKKLFHLLDTSNSQDKNLFQMKIRELNRHPPKPFTINNIFDQSCSSLIEKQLADYFQSNNQSLMNILVQTEYRLSEPMIGMILDQLEKLDSKLSSTTSSIYSNPLLFSQRTHSSISQRLLLKQFLHSCDWSTILNCIYDLLTPRNSSNLLSLPISITDNHHHHHRLNPSHSLKQSRCSLIHNHDSTLILDMLEAFIKLSPLWSGREFKMLDRCHDDLLIDLNSQHIYRLIIYILDEGDRCSLSKEELCQQYQKRYERILYHLIQHPEKKVFFRQCLEKILIDLPANIWMKEILTSFYFILYLNQTEFFTENFSLILSDLFLESKQLKSLQINYDYFIHDLLIRLNSYETISLENFHEINLLLKQYVTKYPLLFLRYLEILKFNLQSRLTIEEYNRNSKQRIYFRSILDLIYRLKPLIYDRIYEKDFQAILDIYIRLLTIHLSTLNTCTKQNLSIGLSLQDYLNLIERCLYLIWNYFYSTINNQQHAGLLKIYQQKFLEKLQEKIQNNKDLHQYLLANKQNQILYHLKQLKILYEAVKTEEMTDCSNEVAPFDVRLCLIDRSFSDNPSKQSLDSSSLRTKPVDLQYYQKKLSYSIDEYTSSIIIDEILFHLNELKSHLDNYLPIDHIELLVPSLTNYLLTGNKQLIDQTYEFILKYLDKSPEHAKIFYSTYIKCLLSTNSIVFQTALDHFSYFIIYFQSKSSELFSLLLRQGLINKIDVTSAITQAIRLLNLHRYDPLTTITND